MPDPASLSADVPHSSEEIASDIAQAIVERRLPPNTKLKEEALARLYAVSRTKIRAALLMLSKDGLIEIVPDKGACVCTLTPKEAQDIFQVRRILEAALAREFVQRAGPNDYALIDQHMALEREALRANDTQWRARLLGKFHTLLADIVGNHVLSGILTKLTARTSLVAMHHQSASEALCSSDEHGQFIAAAKTGNVELAVEVMTHHLNHVEQMLQSDGKSPGRKDLVHALLINGGT